MPPVTPRATFMVIRCGQPQRRLRVVPESLIQHLRGLLGRAASFRDLPFHFARADFILGNAAGLTGIGLHYRRRSGLQLAGSPGRDQNVAIVAVETFDQFHGILSLAIGTARFSSSKLPVSLFLFFSGGSQEPLPYFPTKLKVVGASSQ